MRKWEEIKASTSKKTLLEITKEDFSRAAEEYKNNPNFYNSYQFLTYHPAFWCILPSTIDGQLTPFESFQRCLYIEVVRVDPSTGCVENDDSKNTQTVVWLESGPWYSKKEMEEFCGHEWSDPMGGHACDHELDCGGDTFEEAIIKLAALVLKHYGLEKPPLHNKDV